MLAPKKLQETLGRALAGVGDHARHHGGRGWDG
jgi:hypothetical protein